MSAILAFPALRQPKFRAYFVGVALAMMADSIEHVISYWMIFQKFQSPTLGGFAIVAHWLPFLLLSVYSGALADRFDPRRMIQIGMGLFMAASLGWGVLFLTDTLQMWHAAALLVLHGLAGVTWAPAAQLLIHHLLDDAHLPSGVRLVATARWLGLMMGPAVGGVILLMLGPTYGIFFNALIYLPFAIWLTKAPYSKKPAAPRLRGFTEVIATLREASGNRVILSMTLLVGCASLLVGNAYHAQIPQFAQDFGHVDADFTYTMLFAADAAGALIAGLALESRGLLPPRARTAFTLAILWCFAIAGFAVSTSYPLALALLFAAGFFELAFYAMAQTLVQLNAPPHLRGRLIGVFLMSSLGMRAFAGVTVGLGGSLIGVHWSLAVSAGLVLASILILRTAMKGNP
jgi:MFS family permease